MLIDNIALFSLIVSKGSMVAAAKEAGLSPTTVSDRLAMLEAHYGVVLLNRTTRALNVTDEGRTLLEGGRAVIDALTELETRVKGDAQNLSGHIRISAPNDLGHHLVSHSISDMVEEYPALKIELLLSDGFVDIVEQGIDIALRFGNVPDSSLRVRPLGTIRRVVCAAPGYLKRHPAPQTPEDLTNHNCLLMRFGQTLDNLWPFKEHNKSMHIRVAGNRSSNNGLVVKNWALEGLGIALKSELDVAQAVKDGALVELLTDYQAPPLPLQMIFPPSRAQPNRVKEMADRLMRRIVGP